MPVELRVPEVGESISEVTIGDWLKQVGDPVQRDEPVVVIETDKVTVELLSPAAGRLSQVVLAKGASAHVRDVVGWLEEADVSDADGANRHAAQAVAPPAESIATESPKNEPLLSSVPTGAPPPAPTEVKPQVPAAAGSTPGSLGTTTAWASPSVRRAKAAKQAQAETAVPQQQVSSSRASAVALVPPPSASDSTREEEAVAMTPFRRTIAERLVQSKNDAALLTTFNEVDMSNVQELRHRYQEAFQKRHQIKLGMMSFFVRAVVEALKQLPVLNAEIRGQDIIYKNYFDVGVAVGGGRGLVVPVIRNAEHLGLAEIEKAIADFAERAKGNKLQLAELVGGTFTISNGGVYGSMLSTPIVNPPQSGILGLHAIQERPVARDGQVVIRPMMYIALTYDHRIVDGREAVTFLRLVKEFIEQPARILLEV